MKPLISVIIPTFNREKHIKGAIESVLVQTYANLEVIVVDDGSTDSTAGIIRQIVDPRLHYIHTKNRGNYFARNVGLVQAKGEFIAFLDSDDRFTPNKLEVQFQQFEELPSLGLCCSNVCVRHQDIPGRIFEDAAHCFDYDIDNKNGFIERAVENNFIVTSSVLIRKECVDQLGSFNTQYQNAMDYEFFLRIIFNYPSVYLKDKLVERLIHSSAVSKNSMATNAALLYIFSECAERFQHGKMFSPIHGEMLADAKEKRVYFSGMDYLLRYQFTEAVEYLMKTKYKKKVFFKNVALFIAKNKLTAFIPLIISYRNYKNYISLHRNPSVIN